MKIIQPQNEPLNSQRSFLIYGEPKAGKTHLALSLTDIGSTLLLAFETDGWQDAYHNLPPESKINLTVIQPETLDDLRDIPSKIRNSQNIKAVVVDSVTAMMQFVELNIKRLGGKHIQNGLSSKLTLASYGDLAGLSIDFIRNLKATGKHLVMLAGVSSEHYESADGGSAIRKVPLLTGSKTSEILPYEVRAIAYLRDINGKRELWFESSGGWMAGTNYPSLRQKRMIESPTFKGIFSLFPKIQTPPPNEKTDEPNQPPQPAEPALEPAPTDSADGADRGMGDNQGAPPLPY